MIKVALIDDREDHRALAHAWLDGRYAIRCFSDVRSALRAFESWVPAVVFMDLMMPGLDGIDGLHRLRSLGTPLDAVPVVAFTAHALPGDEGHYRAHGFQGLLVKPVVDPSEFTREIERLAG